jgi:hypothetical protein
MHHAESASETSKADGDNDMHALFDQVIRVCKVTMSSKSGSLKIPLDPQTLVPWQYGPCVARFPELAPCTIT